MTAPPSPGLAPQSLGPSKLVFTSMGHGPPVVEPSPRLPTLPRLGSTIAKTLRS
ncbi:hypothetical protein FH972_012811 [Carpinus fangiana]|uniref:Uncharacterized protein n=1 Tax=Carpinus fangiana TaxID=176857 RepID=A0A5N6R853_9ROSI|nr:hypothetical protein FH972_012811 [Carpinus fangiana]